MSATAARLFGARAAEEPDLVAAFVDDEDTRAILARLGEARGWAASAIQEGGIAAAVRTLAVLPPPRLLIVDLGRSHDPMADIAALAELLDDETRTIALGTLNDVELFRRLLEAGIGDYLIKPVTAEALEAALAKAERPNEAEAPQPRGRLIAVCGARGGVGASTLAVNLGWLGARELARRTVLVDLDLRFGTLALALDVEPGRGLREALERPDRIDELFVERALVSAGERLSVLGGEEPLGERPRIDALGLSALIEGLRAKFDAVIVDLPRELLLAQASLLGQADALLIVTELTLAGLRDSIRLDHFARDQAPSVRRLIVANRADVRRHAQVSRAEFEKGLEARLDHVVPDDSRTAAKAANGGTAFAAIGRKGKALAALRPLAADLFAAKTPRRRFSLWTGS